MTELTPRQLQMLPLIAAGDSNQRIAAKLGVHEATVATYLADMYRRLGAVNRTNAVHLAWQAGLLHRETA